MEDRFGSFWMYQWVPCCGCGECRASEHERRRIFCAHCCGRGSYLRRFADSYLSRCAVCLGLGWVNEFRAASGAS